MQKNRVPYDQLGLAVARRTREVTITRKVVGNPRTMLPVPPARPRAYTEAWAQQLNEQLERRPAASLETKSMQKAKTTRPTRKRGYGERILLALSAAGLAGAACVLLRAHPLHITPQLPIAAQAAISSLSFGPR